MDPALMTLAEEFVLHVAPRRHFIREVTDRYVLSTSNSGASVVRLRLRADEIEDVLAEVRARLATEDVRRCEWWCSPSTTPPDLAARLLDLGLEPDDEEPVLTVMTLDHAPGGEPTTEVRRVETFEDFLLWDEVSDDGWGHDADARARRRARAEQNWQAGQEQGAALYLAYVEGEPVAAARGLPLDGCVLLLGAATRPEARGRGAYVSLVHARWQDAVARGTPRLLIQAGSMSRPILARLGFRALGEIRLVLDRL